MVTVVIPSFGDNTNPKRAIDSVFSQTYKNVEVIFVDDNGLGTEQQIRNKKELTEFYKDNSHFKYIAHEKNMNGSAARNTGARLSNGEYLCFLDDDDFFSDPAKIEKQIQAISNCDLNLNIGGSFSSLHIYKNNKLSEVIRAKNTNNLLVSFIKGKLSIGTAAPIIKKECFFAINGFDESFERHQDWEFFSRFLDKYSLIAVPDTYYDRCYKDTKRKKVSLLKNYLDKYVTSMKKSLTSISHIKLKRLLKSKYYPLYFSSIKQKDKNTRKLIKKENHFNLFDYFKLGLFLIKYFSNKVFRG